MALTRPRYSQIPDSDYKNSCKIVTTTDVTLSGGTPETYDGVVLVQYDRVLVAGQTDKTQNGIYSVQTVGSGSNGTWVRSKDANANDRLTAGMNTFVEEGAYTGQFWHLLTPGPIVLGVTELVFGQISGNAAGTSSQIQYNLNGSIAGAANLRYDFATGNVVIGGGTAATSNVTGALTVNGGIGVSGEAWVYGNVYSAGSRVLTAQDLETVTFTANYISKDPSNVAVPVVGTGTIYGTHNFGNLEAISTYGDYNTTAESGYYSVNDASGAPGFIVYVGFTGITSFNRAVFNINYTQLSGHTITLDFYNYDTDAWDPFATYSGLGNWQSFALGVIDANPYIDTAGNVTTRVYHVSNGNTAHRTWIDYVALEQSVTGGQGPRGATGATGPSGTYTGGYISGVIVTGGNIITSGNIVSNSSNVSINTTTGALILTGEGGAGIGGNVNVGGNVNASAFYTLNGLFWSANGLAFSSGLTVSEIDTANAVSNVSTSVTSIRFDRDTGFSVLELDPGNVKVSLGSSFKTWHVPGQADVVAVAEDEVTFFGNGIDITTNPTYPKALTFIANNSILEANIGTLFLGNASINANLGAYQLYANANIDSIYNNVNTLDANVGILYLGNITTQANIGTIKTDLAILDANVAAYQFWANNQIDGAYSEINALDMSTESNAAAQAASINAINANIGEFYTYANSKIGTNTNSNLVVTATQDAVSTTTGALVVAGGVGIGGNLWVAGNIYSSNVITVNTSTISVQDPLIYLDASNPEIYNYDIGFFSHFLGGALNNYQHSGLARNYVDNTWTFFSNVFSEPGITINWSEANILYDPIKVGAATISNTTAATNTTTGALVVAGGAGIAGALHIANTGDVSANIGLLHDANIAINANLGAYQTYVDSTLIQLDADIVNFGTYANANIGTLYLGNITTQANLGAFQSYANANIGTLYLGNITTNANLGAFQTYANTSIGAINANLGAFQTYSNANAATTATAINTTNANIGAFYTYANSKIGTNTNSNLVVVATTTSTSTTTGALVVAGGVGIAGNLYATGNVVLGSGTSSNLVANATTTSTSATTGALVVKGGLGVAGNAYVTGNVILGSGATSNVVIAATTASGNINSGALVVKGGMGVTGATFLGSGSTTSNLVAAATTTSTSTTTGALVVAGGVGIAGSIYGGGVLINSGNIVAASTAVSTSTTTGALVVRGGAGIAGVVVVGGNIVAASGTASTTTTTGALVVVGGVGVSGAINSGTVSTTGNITAGGNITVTSNITASKMYTTNGVFWASNNEVYGGAKFTTSETAPGGPEVGDFWYYTTDQILFQYINDGTTDYWVDIQTAPLNANISHDFVIGNTTIGGNVTIAGNTSLGGNTNIESSIVENVYTVIDAAGVNITPLNGTMQLWTLSASRTPTTTFYNGQSMTLMITAGAYSITWTTMGVTWITGVPPVLSTSSVTVVEFWKAGGVLYGGLVGTV